MLLIILHIILIPIIIGIFATAIFGRRWWNKRNVVGILFHSISTDSSSGLSHFSSKKFANFLDSVIEKNIKTYTVNQVFHDNNKNSSKASEKTRIAITFDDGYEDFYTNAYPELKKRNLTATIFTVTSSIDKYSEWDVYAPKKGLSKEQLIELSDNGIEIGSHTVTHPDLTRLSDKDVFEELRKSKKILEDIIQRPVTSLSFPFGNWNNRIWRIAVKCGYISGTIYQNRKITKSNLLPVYGVYSIDKPDDIFEIILQEPAFSYVRARCSVLPHFAKGTPLWKFRKNYNFFRSKV